MERVNAHNGESDFGESELKASLKALTRDLIPNNRYELSLKKISLNARLASELEAANGVSLSRTQGVDIDLSYSEEAKDLHIERIIVNLAADRGCLHILDTHSPYGYAAIRQGVDTVSISQSSPLIDESLVEDIRTNLGLQSPPIASPYEYRLWLSNIIDSSDGWELIERMSLCEGMSGCGNYGMVVEREQVVHPDDIVETHAFKYTIGVSDGVGATDIYTENLSLIDYMRPESHSSLSATFTKHQLKANPFIPNHDTVAIDEHRPLALDESKISYFMKLIQIAINEREILATIPND